jgi:hypothetical protein
MDSKLKWLTYGIQKGLILLLGFVALWAGALVYIHLRSSNPLFIRWIKSVGCEKLFSFNQSLNIYLPVWLVYSLPSALWAFAYSILITGIWWFSSSWLKYIWLTSIIVLAIGWEFLQLIGLASGTFSLGDILSGIIGAAIGVLLGIKIIKPKYHEKESV